MLMENVLPIEIHPQEGPSYSIDVEVARVGCSRNSSRDITATEQYLERVRADGYLVHGAGSICFKSRYLLTTETTIEVQGPQTMGEVEFAAFKCGDGIYVSVASDHNDRSMVELWTSSLGKIYDSAKSKQIVPAVMAKDAWLYEDVKGHWEELVLKSFVTVSDQKIPYQEFTLGEIFDLDYYSREASWFQESGSILLGGSCGRVSTVPNHVYQGQTELNGVLFPTDFHFEMYDPVLKRVLRHGYDVISLEDPGSLSL